MQVRDASGGDEDEDQDHDEPRGPEASAEPLPTMTPPTLVRGQTLRATRVQPRLPPMPRARTRERTPAENLRMLYEWLLWGTLLLLLLSQLLGVVWDASTSTQYQESGQHPRDGAGPVALTVDDEPYVDRCLVCLLRERQYRPVYLDVALGLISGPTTATATVTVEGTTTMRPDGYRLLTRTSTAATANAAVITSARATTLSKFTKTCDHLASTMDAIIDSCAALGFNVTADYLRVVVGRNADTLLGLPESLPVLIQPLKDRSNAAPRYVLPGSDGRACIVRLAGRYENEAQEQSVLVGTAAVVVANKTLEWLGREGRWRNGWYEEIDDPRTMRRWHVDLVTTTASNVYGFTSRQFDTRENVELACNLTVSCPHLVKVMWWGPKFAFSATSLAETAISISDGTGYGLFRQETTILRVIQSVYDLETFISNVSLLVVYLRWLVCMYAMQNGYRRRTTNWYPTGLGGLACMRHFHFLLIVLLPRLKATSAAFWSVGCYFEGEQVALAESWFVVFPAICEFMILLYSFLNLLAKVLRLRVSDVCFGPSMVALCALHIARKFFVTARDGTVNPLPTVLSSAEFTDLHLFDMFRADVVLQINGNVRWLYYTKVGILVFNVLPILKALISRSGARITARIRESPAINRFEKAMALRVGHLAGYGRVDVYEAEPRASFKTSTTSATDDVPVISSYELVRLGYVVLGESYVISIDDWHLLVLLAPFRRSHHPPNFRILVFTIVYDPEHDRRWVSVHPELCRINDPRLQAIELLELTAWAFH